MKFPSIAALMCLAALSTGSAALAVRDPLDPDPDWVKVALKEPFKQQQVQGKVNGFSVKLNRATIQPFRDGAEQVIYLMQNAKDGTLHNVQVWLPFRESLEGKTVYFPCKNNGNDASLAIYRKSKGTEYGCGSGSSDENICGRITFGKIDKDKLSGYISVRFVNDTCKRSYLNGYFYANIVKEPKKYPMNMFK